MTSSYVNYHELGSITVHLSMNFTTTSQAGLYIRTYHTTVPSCSHCLFDSERVTFSGKVDLLIVQI